MTEENRSVKLCVQVSPETRKKLFEAAAAATPGRVQREPGKIIDYLVAHYIDQIPKEEMVVMNSKFKKAILDVLNQNGGVMSAKEIAQAVTDTLGLDRVYRRTGYYLTDLHRGGEIIRVGRGLYKLA